VPRDDLAAGEDAIARSLSSRGAGVTMMPMPGYAGMMREPEDAVVPAPALDAIADWLKSVAPAPARGASIARRGECVIVARSAARWFERRPCASAPTIASSAS